MNKTSSLEKNAMLNPTNLGGEADDIQTQLTTRFSDRPDFKNLPGFRVAAGDKLFYSGRRFRDLPTDSTRGAGYP